MSTPSPQRPFEPISTVNYVITGNTMSTSKSIFDVIEEEAAKQTNYVKIESGQKVLLKFDPAKISIVENEFQGKKTKRVMYKVIDPNDPFNEKEFKIGFNHAKQLNALLKAGLYLIVVERNGTGLGTKYTFAPGEQKR
jgi:hypothetical protein